MAGRYEIPTTLEGWGTFDWTQCSIKDIDPQMHKLLKKVEMTSILADCKMETQADSFWWTLAAKLYRPAARFRLRNNFYSLMPESVLMK